MRIRLIPALCLAAGVLALAACKQETPTPTQVETLSGSVLYRERIMLPPNAELEVALQDVSLADAPAKVLASTKIKPEGQVPIPFTLSYDPSKIESGHSYALQARITSGDELIFINTSHHSALTGAADKNEILVQKVN